MPSEVTTVTPLLESPLLESPLLDISPDELTSLDELGAVVGVVGTGVVDVAVVGPGVDAGGVVVVAGEEVVFPGGGVTAVLVDVAPTSVFSLPGSAGLPHAGTTALATRAKSKE